MLLLEHVLAYSYAFRLKFWSLDHGLVVLESPNAVVFFAVLVFYLVKLTQNTISSLNVPKVN